MLSLEKPMKFASRNDINFYTSGSIGLLGVCLLIIPNSVRGVFPVGMGWFLASFGAAILSLALVLQFVSIIEQDETKYRVVHGFTVVTAIFISFIYFRAGGYIEGCIFLIMACLHWVLSLNPEFRILKVDLINLSFICMGFLSGILLAVGGNDYLQINIGGQKAILAGSFLVFSLLGAGAAFLPNQKFRNLLIRFQVFPWLLWLAFFIPTINGAVIIPVTSVILLILLHNRIPWEQASLSQDDVLGHRVVAITGVLEFGLSLFIAVLLTLMELLTGISNSAMPVVRDVAFFFLIIVTLVMYYQAGTIVMTINGLMHELTFARRVPGNEDESEEQNTISWRQRLTRYIRPFLHTREGTRGHVEAQGDQIKILNNQISNEKIRNTQLTLLLELSQQLESQLDQPVAAQLAVNMLERAVDCSLVTIYIHDTEQQNFMLLAAAGSQTSFIPAGYRQNINIGAIGKAVRQRKTQVISDIRIDSDYVPYKDEANLSAVIIPMIFNGHVNGVIVLNSENLNAFGSIDVGLAESVAAELSRAWERSGYHQRLKDLIQTGSHLASMVEPNATSNEIASIARETLEARYTFVHIHLGQEKNFSQSAFSGKAPLLTKSLQNPSVTEVLIQTAFQAAQPFRIRDVRRYPATARLTLDNNTLRSLLVIPISWNRMKIGAIFAFGKQKEVFFTENDESLAELLSVQAAGAFESTWLQQELRSSLRTITLLYRMSNQIIQADNLEDAAKDIVHTVHKQAKSILTGIVLIDENKNILTQLTVDEYGQRTGSEHPISLINEAVDSGQIIYFSQGKSLRTCLPIKTPIRNYGALWMDVPEELVRSVTHDRGELHSLVNTQETETLVNQAAIALERSLLLVESRRQAIEIKEAYDMLEITYDQTLASLTSALDARDRETEGHSMRVSTVSKKLGEMLGFSNDELKILERGALLHDIGKIGISDAILHKPGKLNEKEWEIMREHPAIGAKIVKGIPFLEETIPLILHHQERWDGSGYPSGLKGEKIPMLARMFAVIDTFDALTSIRPYRTKISIEEALAYLREEAGILYDPKIVEAFCDLVLNDTTGFIFTEQNTQPLFTSKPQQSP